MSPFYVGLCHIRPRSGLTEPVMEQFVRAVRDHGGVVRRVNNSGIRPLPTEMRGKSVGERHKFASITSIEFVANPKGAVSASQAVRGLDDVMRVSLLRADEILQKRPPRPIREPPKAEDRPSSSKPWQKTPYKDRFRPYKFDDSKPSNVSQHESTEATGKRPSDQPKIESARREGNATRKE